MIKFPPAALLLYAVCLPSLAGELDYSVTDPELKLLLIDSSPTESFLAVRADTMGRLFVGGRERLFVYDPADDGGYQPRRELIRFPNHTWVYDIEFRGDDLYVMTVSALYVIPGGVTHRENLKVKRLIWGVPLYHVHQCFHALAWGPDGCLYFSMGDPLVYYGDYNRPDHWGHWTFFTQPEGTRVPCTGVGGVFRCRPDGSNLEVVARGTRNSCGLAFDRHGNLFSNDNDHESIPAAYVPGRLLHVTPRTYFSWPRGWMASKTPERFDLLDTMFDGMGRAVPVGETCYDETFLPSKYRNNLLLARWCTRAVTRYPLEHRGASFSAKEHVLLAGRNDARPVGVSIGRGGRIFVTIAYMAHNEASPIYKSDLVVITRADDQPAQPFDAYDAVRATPDRLWVELRQPSLGQRHRAQVEILRRGGELLHAAASRLVAAAPDDLAVPHLIWLAAASGSRKASDLLRSLATHTSDTIRLQAVRALAEFPGLNAPSEIFVRALADTDPQVRLAAVCAFFKLAGDLPEAIVLGPARSKDTYLRQAATLLLAERASFQTLQALSMAPDWEGRMAAVLAMGFHLTLPAASRPLDNELPLEPYPSEGPYLIQFYDAKVDLRRYGRLGNFTVADHWRAGHHTSEQERLFARLLDMISDKDEQVRRQAAFFLFLLNDRRSEPKVASVRRESEERRLASAQPKSIGTAWLAGPFPDDRLGSVKPHPPELGAIDLAAEYQTGKKRVAWVKHSASYADLRKMFGSQDHSSYYAYCRLESATRQPLLLGLGSDSNVKIWHNGRVVLSHEGARAALPFQDTVRLELQPGANDILIRIQRVSSECGIYLHYRALDHIALTLPERLGSALLVERLKTATVGVTEINSEFLKIDWTKMTAAGDPQRGRVLFGELGCAKCHAIAASASVSGGPSLSEAAKRFTIPYLVESILLPSKQVSPLFRSTLIETKTGQVVSGLVVAETGNHVELLLPDTTTRMILKSDIANRRLQESSPMPAGLVKTPTELRDLLAFILKPD